MKKITVLFMCLLMMATLFGCGESKPKCEHKNTKTSYEVSTLSITKLVTCTDCEEQVSKTSLEKVSYVYNKPLIDENGIKVTLVNAEIDGWDTFNLCFEVEGTSNKKRTFSIEKMFVKGYDVNAWIYCSDLSGNKKSLEKEWLTDIKGNDFFASQDYKVDIQYQIMDSDSYKTLSEKEISFNLNEFTKIEEVEPK